MTDMVNHPPHYMKAAVAMEIEPIDVDECFGFCRGNALKYIARADFKGKHDEDLQKALWYLDRAKHPRFGFDINGRAPDPRSIQQVWFYLTHSDNPVFKAATGKQAPFWESLEAAVWAALHQRDEADDLTVDGRYMS